ncbi:bifunctional serine/threonine-protein kinase/formylglycine-generating enzyme family protein [Actinomadura rupiterrae]|uniref:bifunctional serine/threonine-protein kinase/formylglycine-generating enzyme family protein n=1 Tax=Actinomadura rupiterrae TaxID=559627 RepID=UPI0020A50F4B|nr:bifunctional serine/threonine-protein kinase/formylglycine-generating enzyme family protein [Actinomadura rupiterrae]MCP2334702.1 formylglycine-generating enzyme required for sulfatase activity [Actinomadura rupiterrae]
MGLSVGRELPTGETVIRIHHGGFGEVGVLQDAFGGHKVLKRIRDEVLQHVGESVSEAFFQECRVAANQLWGAPYTALAVQAMIRLEDLGPVLYMDYVDGPPLHELIGGGRRQSLCQSLRMGLQLATAIEFAHARDVRHRDIKPSNILLTRGNEIRLIDWGLSKAHDEAGIPTRVAAYMSPQRQVDNRLDDPADDVYALGVILFECLTGGYPRETAQPDALRARLTALLPVPPATLVDLLVGMLDGSAEARPSAAQVVAALSAPELAVEVADRENELPFCRVCEYRSAVRDARCPVCGERMRERVARPELAGMRRIPTGVFHHGLSPNQVTTAVNLVRPQGEVQEPDWLSPENDPPRKMHLPTFDIDETPVTNEQYAEFVKATDYPMPKGLEAGARGLPDHPVVNVTWRDALCYALWAGKRLPTPLEWEKAARGDQDDRAYPWGDVWQPDRCNHNMFLGRQFRETSPVRAFVSGDFDGRSPFGIADMAGNVGEWVSDPRAALRGHPDMRKVCGGGWSDPGALCGMVSIVRPAEMDYQGPSIGFRCAADPIYDERLIEENEEAGPP